MRSRYEVGREMMEMNTDLIRCEAEQCDRVEDILFYSSQAGGTASGMLTRIIKDIDVSICPKSSRVLYSVVPSANGLGSEVVTHLNNVLAIHEKLNLNLLDIWVDNASLYRICETYLGIESPSLEDINRLVAQQASSLTQSRRFGGTKNKTFGELRSNLISYPHLEFFSTSRAFLPQTPP